MSTPLHATAPTARPIAYSIRLRVALFLVIRCIYSTIDTPSGGAGNNLYTCDRSRSMRFSAYRSRDGSVKCRGCDLRECYWRRAAVFSELMTNPPFSRSIATE